MNWIRRQIALKLKFIVCLILVFCAALLGGCAGTRSVTIHNRQISDIRMFNVQDGWAEAYGPGGCRILKTSDGARHWKNVTPCPFPYDVWSC
ncbi:MAG: hypothetical protein ACREFR_09195, partial [Limisphaerales bacterium]